MLDGGYAHVYGRGEKINLIACAQRLHLVVAKGGAGCPTKDAYAAFDRLGKRRESDTAKILRAMTGGDILAAVPYFTNDLQEASVSLCPEISAALELLRGTDPLRALMSGSGSACFGVYGSEAAARAAYSRIAGKTAFCAVCGTVGKGIVEL
jgi:4-diphosphocytidyl-2-C-methyl-D-erythritol kinase